MEKFIQQYLKDNGYGYAKINNDNDLKIIYDLYHDNIICENTDKLSSNVLRRYAMYYQIKKDDVNMLKYYLLAIDKGDTNAMNNLAQCYVEKNDYDNMLKYYLMAVDKGDTDGMCKLGDYYYEQNDYKIC